MALTRAKKALKVTALAEELAGSTSAIVGTFAKLTVSQDFALRQKVREAGGRYRVLKNKLAARASLGTGIEGALQGLKGVSSVAYTSGDPVALAKALSAWVKDNAEFTFKLGIIDGKVITVEQVQSLATMPSKDEIFAKLLFLISAPAQRLVTVINAAGRDLAVVINQGVEKGKFADGAAGLAAAPAQAGAVSVEASPAAEVSMAEAVSIEAAPVEAAPGSQAVVAAEAAVAGEALVVDHAVAPVPLELEHVGAAAAEGAPVESAAVETVPVESAPVESAPVESAPVESAPAEVTAAETASHPEGELAEAPAPAEGPAAEGGAAEVQSKQAEEAASEDPVEG